MPLLISPNIRKRGVELPSKTFDKVYKKHDKVYVIGGGSSLDVSSLKNLNDGDIIAVNKAIEYVPMADFFITMDYTFLSGKSNMSQILAKSKKTFFVANLASKHLNKDFAGNYYDSKFNIKYSIVKQFSNVVESSQALDFKTGFGLNLTNFANGYNSGFCAIQLAILLEYSEIHLLGFDLTIINSKTHFHNLYTNTSHFTKNLELFQNTFATAFKKLPASQLNKFVSHSKVSFLNQFLTKFSFDMPTSKSSISLTEVASENNTVITNCENPKFNNLLVVGYFTINTPYAQEKDKLVESIKKFKLGSYIKGVPNLGDWQKNTRYKATFLKEILEKFPTKDILYVDADAEFLKEPDLFSNYNCDIAIRWQDFRWRKNESLSGTIFMKNNSKTKEICNKWIRYNDLEGPNPNTYEQWNLGKLIKEFEISHKLIHKLLPAAYCSFDHIRDIYPEIKGKEVIVHYQASRRLKNKLS